MSNQNDIHHKIVEFIDSGKSFAVAVILDSNGSTPAKIGGKAIIADDGKIFGTIGGGQVEAMAQERAIEACKSKKPIIFDLAFEGVSTTSSTPVCGGDMRVLIDPTANTKRQTFAAAAKTMDDRLRGVLLTKILNDNEIAVDYEWLAQGEVPVLDIAKCIDKENAQHVTIDSIEVLIEPIIPRPVLLIAGGGHVGQAVAVQANLVGFDVVVFDDRTEFTQPELFGQYTRTRSGDVTKELTDFGITDNTFIVIVTRGHNHDAKALKACIHSQAAYIGMIGSKHKITVIRKDLIESGNVTADQFKRVFAPVGVDIGAVTVPEIAMSITAQLVSVRRKGKDRKVADMVQR